MTRRPKRLIKNPPSGLRERARTDGSVRLWWEPSAEARAKGMKPVVLDAQRLTWSVRKAEDLNREATRAPRKSREVGQTIDHVIDDYESGRRFKRLAAATLRDYRSSNRIIREKWGSRLVADFSKPVLNTWYETLLSTRGKWMALKLIRAMSILFSHAELRGWRAEGSNPCQRLGMEVPKGRRRNGTWAELDALVTTADRLGIPAIGTACLLSCLQGQRQTDVMAAAREEFREVAVAMPGSQTARFWVWQLTRQKRGNEGTIVLHPEVQARILPILAVGPATGPLLIDGRSGTPMKPDLFRDRFEEVRAEAIKAGCPSLADLQFRDLRRTFGAFSRAGGAAKDDVGDVLGNSAAVNQPLGDIYMAPQLLTGWRAVSSIQRPEKDERKQA